MDTKQEKLDANVQWPLWIRIFANPDEPRYSNIKFYAFTLTIILLVIYDGDIFSESSKSMFSSYQILFFLVLFIINRVVNESANKWIKHNSVWDEQKTLNNMRIVILFVIVIVSGLVKVFAF